MVLSAVMISFMTCGCATPKPGLPLAPELTGNDPDTQIDFWHSLVDQRITTNDEAFHGLLLYADGKDDCADYAARVETLRARKWVSKHWDEPATAAVRRGVVAVALMRILHDRGGVTTTIFGPTPRYATRELNFLQIYPPSTPNQAFSGNEFVGIIGRVEDFQRGNPENVSAQTMPGELYGATLTTQPTAEP